MIEVFKTNVTTCQDANRLLDLIHEKFDGYAANFDLQDCDHILRVKVESSWIQCSSLIRLMNDAGHHAEILSDEIPNAFSRPLDILNLRIA